MAEIRPVRSSKEIELTAHIADIVWREHYIPIVGKAQIDYMLEKFQSVKAMQKQISEGYFYYLLWEGEEAVGYFAIQLRDTDLFLSKLYVLSKYRNQGHARSALNYIDEFAADHHSSTISLTVNKNNTGSIQAYERLGFVNVGPIVADIGNGYIMDDYKMVKRLTLS